MMISRGVKHYSSTTIGLECYKYA